MLIILSLFIICDDIYTIPGQIVYYKDRMSIDAWFNECQSKDHSEYENRQSYICIADTIFPSGLK